MTVEEQLLEGIARKDQEAFREFYGRTVRPVHSYILSLTGSRQEAEDVMQDTFLKIWTCAGEYQAKGKPLAWVFTIARNQCYMRFREQKKRGETCLEELEGPEMGEHCLEIEQAPERQQLLWALSRLKEEDRQVVLLYAAAGMKHREIAGALGMPLSTELAKYSRSMKRLQEMLRGQEQGNTEREESSLKEKSKK